MANNPFKVPVGAYALAATPFIAVPIQNVQLLDYAVANETANSGRRFVCSSDTYMGLFDKEIYTSDQQRERDQFELNNEDWNEVVFEEIEGLSVAKLALHNAWIEKNRYELNAVVPLDLPEQGISGLFKITSIRHMLPQKKPVNDDPSDDYSYRPVTALISHTSDQVLNITFDNNEIIGVTSQHPIYSVTAGDWRLAGELEVGEKVLTYQREATVTNTEKKAGSEVVYNLEIKDLHNFLVGDGGVVVHNNYFLEANKLAKFFNIPRNKLDGYIAKIIDEWEKDFPYWLGENPDVGYNKFGKLIFKCTQFGPNKGKIWPTDFDINHYILE
jgi:hypothetical protein